MSYNSRYRFGALIGALAIGHFPDPVFVFWGSLANAR